MAFEYQLAKEPITPISCHAWNKDRSMIAISPNSPEVHIYRRDGDKFTLVHVMKEHTQRVTAIDWASNTNKLVTCGQDRNAYVWECRPRDEAEKAEVVKDRGFKLDEASKLDKEMLNNVWVPTLVILRINRAATCVKFSPNEDKFAVGSGARLVSVCYFEEDNDWWVSKHIKKPIRSTVLSVDWHPNNCILAVGGSDFKCRVFGAAIKGVDKKPEATCWGSKAKVGELLGEFSTGTVGGGWIHDVSFSADGNLLAYVSHDSSVYVVDGPSDKSVTRLATGRLPFRAVQWISPGTFVTAGHDYVPFLYSYGAGKIDFVGEVDAREEKKKASKFSALDKFKNLDSRGTSASADLSTSVKSIHQNAVVEIELYEGDAARVSKFSTVGVDGKVVIWDMAEVAKRGVSVA
eukprot:TRINITY_DN6729_c0_g2_i2.p1 TRINITY_DN6729_c0_g2~~TRINITY_DN6729_c0_g2_i2.p1  ORF type:complete len:439 (+),score=119.16 TRINITY_DN6729_c0_g2_i2:103-1317(+)